MIESAPYLREMQSRKIFAMWASIFMALAVLLGAMGAHALQNLLSNAQLDSFNTGIRYQAWHALALFMLQLLPDGFASAKMILWSSRLLIAGILCFSFSIYLLNVRHLLGIEWAAAILGPVTPIGGLLLISAWLVLALAISRSKSVN